ncbi:MAG: cysteine hydrolase [Clostridia bacterium]|nr:cysteine hydrolase [Clostridia bacterium]
MKNILVVVDMQNDFIDGALGTKEAEAIVDKVVDKIKAFDGDIYVTYDTHFENYMDTDEGKNLPVRHCIKDTEGWQLNAKVRAVLDEKDCVTEIEKYTFGSILLPELIEPEDDMTIDLVGLCTDICVVSNALILKAHFPESRIRVDSSCCAGVTPETHNAAIATMKMCQIKEI